MMLETQRYTLALQFSYWSPSGNFTAHDCGDLLKKSLLRSIDTIVESKFNDRLRTKFLSSTQVTIPRLRHSSLAQESGCSAADDVIVISCKAPKGLLDRSQPSVVLVDDTRLLLHQLIELTNERLVTANNDQVVVSLNGCKLLQTETKFHAERSCTQRIIHYLLPLSWFPDGEALEQWWIEHGVLNEDGPHKNRAAVRPPSESLRAMKDALRLCESPSLESSKLEESNSPSTKLSAGRFGKLSAKKRKPWHNFADPDLRGDASPNNEPVWRVIDRARMVEMIRHKGYNGTERVIAVLEFRGDEFLPQQVRRIVGMALAVAHRWLPEETFHLALNSDVIIETPLAPPGRLYLAGSRFHFDELRNGGTSIFSSDVDGISVVKYNCQDVTQEIRKHMLHSLNLETVHEHESIWLHDLKTNVAPRIHGHVSDIKFQYRSFPLLTTSSPFHQNEQAYDRTLGMLRDLLHSGSWPGTSAARASVISNVAKDRPYGEHQTGSFTIVNPMFRDGLYEHGIGNDSLPFANNVFPELVKTVFDLELFLCERGLCQADGTTNQPNSRPASSHCAVNCNAQFRPHVDSGRGAGQSRSMIVGLGDYVGGELAVEGQYYDIRYSPLEFDGWSNRHWTLPFRGERFSLVWFTPEVKSPEVNLIVSKEFAVSAQTE